MSILTEIFQPALRQLGDSELKNYAEQDSQGNATYLELLDYYNEVYGRIVQICSEQDLSECRTAITPIAISEGDASCTLPTNILRPSMLYLSGETTPLDLKSYSYDAILLKHQQSGSGTEKPHYGGLNGNTLIFDPLADDSYSLCGFIYANPADEDDEESDVPNNGIFNKLIKQFIIMQCLNRDEAALNWEGAWMDNLRRGVFKALRRRSPRKLMTPFNVGGDECVDPIWINLP